MAKQESGGDKLAEHLVINCEVDSEPSHVTFQWTFNNSNGESFELDSFESQGSKSTARFLPRATAGTIYCWARNEIGTQTSPCSYLIYPQGKNASSKKLPPRLIAILIQVLPTPPRIAQ